LNKIVEIKFGSYLYGTNTPNSDLDFKGIYLPTAREICLEKVARNVSTSRPKREYEKNTKDDIDSEVFSLKEYLRLLCDGQTVALDMLFSPDSFQIFKGDEYHLFQTIYKNKDRLISKGILSFIGYARKQASKYGIKGSRVRAVKEIIDFLTLHESTALISELDDKIAISGLLSNEFIKYVVDVDNNGTNIIYFEVCGRKFQQTNNVAYILGVLTKIYNGYGQRARQAEENDGIDWKALSHAVRVNYEGQELLRTGFIKFPCTNKQLLLDIKNGIIPYKEVETVIEQGLIDLEAAQANSILRDEPDLKWRDDFVYDVYSSIVKGK